MLWPQYYTSRKKQMLDLLAELRRVLKNKGLLYVCVRAGTGEKIIEKSVAVNEMGPRFFAFYNINELKDLLTRARFKIEYTFADKELDADWLNIYTKKI